MSGDPGMLAALAALVLAAAVLYSSVGHGGASAYLAVMALFGIAPAVMRPTALVMNIFVAGTGWVRFASVGAVPWALLWPLCIGSVPAAFLGGAIALPAQAFRPLLGAIVVFAAFRIWFPDRGSGRRTPPAAAWLIAMGAVLGLVAGLTGIGGGIFLSPVILASGWEDPRRTAGASAVFIVVNSVAGLIGHLSSVGTVPGDAALLTAVAWSGGLYGSWLGARRLPPLALRRLLAVVLVVGGGKLLLEAFFG